jgi:hypothetical protein
MRSPPYRLGGSLAESAMSGGSASRYTCPMCGPFTQTAAFDALTERFGITAEAGANEELTGDLSVPRGPAESQRC